MNLKEEYTEAQLKEIKALVISTYEKGLREGADTISKMIKETLEEGKDETP